MAAVRVHERKLIHAEFEPLRVGRKFAVVVPASSTLKAGDYFLFQEVDGRGQLIGDDCVFRISWIDTTLPGLRGGFVLVSLLEAALLEANVVRDVDQLITLTREVVSST